MKGQVLAYVLRRSYLIDQVFSPLFFQPCHSLFHSFSVVVFTFLSNFFLLYRRIHNFTQLKRLQFHYKGIIILIVSSLSPLLSCCCIQFLLGVVVFCCLSICMVDCRKRSRMAREIGNGLGIFFNAMDMDGGLHGSRLVISLHLIGVVVEFASLLRASRRLNTVVEKGECFWESRILKIAFLPIARGSKWMARDSLRMDVEEPVYARK